MSVDTNPVQPWLPAGLRRNRAMLFAVALIVATVVAGAGWWWLRPPAPKVVEYKMLEPRDIPTALAVAPDGTVWFSIDFSNAVGLLRNGKIERLPKQTNNVDALGIGVDANGNAWFADAPAIAILRISPSGELKSFPLGTPIARLGRLAVAPDGAVWFAESSSYSITRLKNGILTRNTIQSLRGGPYGVAVARDGTVWATLQGGNQLVRITPAGEVAEYEIPTRGSSPTDVAVDANGVVWFLEFRGNKIGRFEGGKFTEFAVPLEGAALSGLAITPDGSVWFGMLRGHSLGRLRDGKFKLVELPRPDARPYSVATDAKGNVWYTDIHGYLGMLPADAAR
jgi:virginiamycin B lyase